MNKKQLLGISMVAIFTISAITISEMPNAQAKQEGKGKPDFIAIFNQLAPGGEEEFTGEKGRAMFWVSGEGDNMEITYKIILNKIDVGEIGNDGTGQDRNDKNGLAHYLWKLHVHPAPGGVHDGDYHHLNIIGPNDDSDVKISGNTISGIWDKSDYDNRTDLPNDKHETVAPSTVFNEMCAGETDVNVHSEVHELQIRGLIVPNSDICD
ncbi:MAG: hypothetical protein PVG43_04215 [Nitrosopumilaceae archaeon]